MGSAALPVLYSFRRCPYAMRARFALVASGTRCALREVVLRNKPAALIEASPKATVPVLVLPSGRVIDQSLDIMQWALARHDPQAWLQPPGETLDAMLVLIAQCDGAFKQQLDRYKYPNRFEGVDALQQRAEGALFLQALDQRLVQGSHLFGDRPTLADMAIAPFVRQFAQVDADWFAAQPWPALAQWLAALTAGETWLAATQKYPPWAPGAAVQVFP